VVPVNILHPVPGVRFDAKYPGQEPYAIKCARPDLCGLPFGSVRPYRSSKSENTSVSRALPFEMNDEDRDLER
jgi:hypothetical protein